ncbi:putative triosephosphate isomerase [Colletotrichum trifolii]|uniref:Triosephosphate isomerase n=1 Tax=Colletotrichum trifolii TaxID=5466 RepID=A0A4R8RJ51_COLTR|nr:putative triosephosphate isomerase [Colletotrichum trifolii]
MMPLICFGELEEVPVEDAVSFCRTQVDAILKETPVREVILAYEPIWAIGKEHPACAKHVVRVLEGVRELGCVKSRGELLRIVYGGSAGPGTFAEMARLVDGLFMARFGLDIEKLMGVVRKVSEARDTLDFVSTYATDHMCQASRALF